MKYNYNPNSARRMPKDLKYERSKLMWEYKTKEGMTLERIARIFGLKSRERVRQVIEDFEAKQKQMGLGLDRDKIKE